MSQRAITLLKIIGIIYANFKALDARMPHMRFKNLQISCKNSLRVCVFWVFMSLSSVFQLYQDALPERGRKEMENRIVKEKKTLTPTPPPQE